MNLTRVYALVYRSSNCNKTKYFVANASNEKQTGMNVYH